MMRYKIIMKMRNNFFFYLNQKKIIHEGHPHIAASIHSLLGKRENGTERNNNP
jgi:hypothetical protein